jgi:hypothetical protein
MTERNIAIGIDPTKSTAGARVVNRDLDSIGNSAQDAERKVQRLGSSANDNLRGMANASKLAGASLGALVGILVGVGAAIAAAFGVSQLFKNFIDGTKEAQAVQAQLAATLKSTAAVSGQTLASLNAMSSGLQKLTAYGDEAIGTAQGILLTFTNIRGPAFERTTKAVLDMSTALGTDLKSSALQVGKALNDPIKGMSMLGRAGVQFSGEQEILIQKLVKTGDVMGAQAVILKELEKEFGGSAAAARNTLGGALSALAEAWGDLFELSTESTGVLQKAIEDLIKALQDPAFMEFVQVIGATLVEGIALAVKGMNGLVALVKTVGDNLDTIAVAAATAGAALAVAFSGQIVGGIVTLIGVLSVGLVGAIRAVGIAIAANPLGALILAITAAVTAVYYFRDEIQKAIGVDAWGIVKSFGNYVIGSMVGVWEGIKTLWANFPDIFEAAMVGAQNALARGANDLISDTVRDVNVLIDMLNMIPKVDIPKISADGITGFKEKANPAADRLKGIDDGLNDRVKKAMARDYLGEAGAAMFPSSQPGTPPGQPGGVPGGPWTPPNGGPSAEDIKKYQEIIDKGNEFIASQQAQARAIGLTEEAARALTIEQDLLNKAKQADLDLTPKQTQELHDLAGAMAAAEAQTKSLKEAYDFNKGTFKSFFTDIASGLESGKSLWKSFADAAVNALKRVADKLMDKALDKLFDLGGTGNNATGGNWLSQGFSAMFGIKSKTGATTPAVAAPAASVAASAATTFAAPVGAVVRSSLPDVGAKATGSIESYIRQRAAVHGIDPDTAVKVAQSEGGLKSWNLQSTYMKNGVQEQSYGPFQLYKGGGLGNAFQKQTGLDPALAQNGPAATDFALKEASKNGWGAWYGAKRVGISNWQGIGQGGAAGAGGGATDAATQSLSKLAETTTDATKNVGTFGSGLGQLGSSLGSLGAGAFPAAPAASGGGGIFSILGGLFGGKASTNTASSQWNAAASGKIFGLFDSGGFTGDGGRKEVAGLVHRGEVVWNQDDVRKAGGAGQVDAMRRGLFTPGGGAQGDDVRGGGGSAQKVDLHVNVIGGSGDDHIKNLADQGARRVLSEYDTKQTRGGFGATQKKFNSRVS